MFRLALNSVSRCLCIFCLNWFQVFAINVEVHEFSRPTDCRKNEYFDTISFSCVQCDVHRNLEPSADRLRCVCNAFSKISGFKNGHPACVFCGSNATVTVDGTDCIPCKNAACKCSSDQIQIDRNLNGTLLDDIYCLSCPNGTYPSLDGSHCLPCNNFRYSRHGNCNCSSLSHVRENNCLDKNDATDDWLSVRNTYLIKFENQRVDSYYLRNELQAAMYFCKRKDRVACEHLSNMCALTLYMAGVPCMLFTQTHVTPIWLFYDKDETKEALNGRRISQRYSLTKNNSNGTLNFTFATFSLDGNFLSLGGSKLPCNLLKNVRFGVNVEKRCKLSVKDLANAKMEFVYPYLTFAKDEKLLTHALPVLITNLNENVDEISHAQLVRKFFLVDNISGFKTLPGFLNDNFKKDKNLSVLRYMRSLSVLVKVQSGKDRGTIFPPILIIEYAELTNEQISEDIEVILDYKITFSLIDSNIDYNLQITIGVLSGLALIFSGIKTWSYCKRNYTCIPNITMLFWFLIYAMGVVGNVIILSLVTLCIYLFIFYKGQTVPYILLPDNINEWNIRIFTAVAFGFKVTEMVGFVYQYWNMDIFFIDWEQPRIVNSQFKYDSPHTSLRKLYCSRFSDVEQKSLQTPSEIIAAKRRRKTQHKSAHNSPSRISKSPPIEEYDTEFSAVCSISKTTFEETNERETCNLPVSIWRTYFVANQWLKLQTKRKISIVLQSVGVLFIFQVLQLYSWTLATPELILSEFAEEKTNFTLYYGLCSLVYIVLYSMQWLVSVVFYERYIKNGMQEFIDLCSIANISLFILPFNYYGFYLHGRSVHGYADTDQPTLIKDLMKEENNLCAHRGLVPGTTEQTFILSLTETFKSIYDELLRQKDIGTNRFLKANHSRNRNWNQMFDTRLKMKQYLAEFIDHCFKDEDYIIKEQHFFEKLCDIQFSNAKEKSIFYIDNNHTFDQVLFYGNEWLLATFEVTVFTFVIVLYENCILASVVTVLISASLIILTDYNGKKNVSNKALLDKRFLM